MERNITRTLTALLLACFVPAAAATVIYDEGTDGDLTVSSAVFSSLPSLVLGPGVNEIRGSSHFFPDDPDDPGDFDAFRMHSSSPILSVEYAFRNVDLLPDPLIPIVETDFELYDGAASTSADAALTGFETVDPGGDTSPVALFGSTLPVAAGTYTLWNAQLSGSGGSWDYTFRITTAPLSGSVPEPPTIALLALGLIGTACVRRRARR